MTHPSSAIALRRKQPARAVHSLDSVELRLLLHLALQADPRSGRSRPDLETLPDDLGVSREAIHCALGALARDDLLEVLPPVSGWQQVIELGEIFVHEAQAPPNLPVEPI